MREKVLEKLKRGRLLFDGAMGTYARTLPGLPDIAVERLVLTAPERVLALHQAYIDAGADAIMTNTFAAYAGMAAEHREEQKIIVSKACRIARQAAGSDVLVFADIGPCPDGSKAVQQYCEMAQMFLDEGISCFIFETLFTECGIPETIDYIRRKCPEAFVVVSFASDPNGFTRIGESVFSLINRVSKCSGVDAVGLNCVCGAYHMRRLIEKIEPNDKWILAMPNAGYPRIENGRTFYDHEPQYYADQVSGCYQSGARIIGGCCGTTPEHIAAINKAIADKMEWQKIGDRRPVEKPEEINSIIYKKLLRKEKVILVELDPPRNADIQKFLEGAAQIAGHDVDAITIADCPIGRARMDASLLACKIQREMHIETVPHMTCRDRNVNATKALLLGLSMEGVKNVLVVTGDPVPVGDREHVKSVFQFNSRVLARFIQTLNDSGEINPFFISGALNVNASNFDAELERAEMKQQAGIKAFLTQPVLSRYAEENIRKARERLDAFLIGGLMPLVSYKNAMFLKNEVNGMRIEKKTVELFSELDRKQGEELGREICVNAAERIAPYVDGYYLMTPFQRVGLICSIVDEIKSRDNGGQ